MRAVWKFPVPLFNRDHSANDLPEITMPVGAKIVHVGRQEQLDGSWITMIWAEVDTDARLTETRCFAVLGTGHEIPDDAYQHVGTWLDGPFVWHLYEAGPS